MLGFGGLSTKLIIAGVLAAAVLGFWFHYQGLHDEIAVLEGNIRQLDTAVELQAQELESQRRAEESHRRLAGHAGSSSQ